MIWSRGYGCQPDKTASSSDASEVKRLKAELPRITEQRDILKKATPQQILHSKRHLAKTAELNREFFNRILQDKSLSDEVDINIG